MKTITDIIEKQPAEEPSRPGVFSIISVGILVYVLYLIDKGGNLSVIDLFLIPAFVFAIGWQGYRSFKTKKK